MNPLMKCDTPITTLVALIISIVAMLFCGAALGADSAGTVKTLTGTANVIREGATMPLAVGGRIFPGDRVATFNDSYVGITLHDDTTLTIGPRSELAIAEFKFDASSYVGDIAVSFMKGTARVVTGLIGKNAPQRIRFGTPTSTIAIRGTDFIVDLEDQE
jgi:hypothetical protein